MARPASAGATVHHRVAPAPIGSGISFRKLPEATAEQVIKACQHYETKCAGHYDARSPAARYLFDLSREVQDLIRVLHSREESQAARIRQLEATMREWLSVFSAPSPALQATGITQGANAPGDVARRVLDLHAALQAREAELVAQRSGAERDVAELRRAVRDAGRVSREQAAAEAVRIRHDAEAAIASERALRMDAVAELETYKAEFHDSVRREVASQVEVATAGLRDALAAARRTADTTSSNANEVREAAQEALDAAHAELEEERAAASEAAEAAAAEAEGLRQQQAALREEMARIEREAADRLQELDDTWRARMTEALEQWQRSTASARVTGLEQQIAYLSRRVSELAAITDAQQAALAAVTAQKGAHGHSLLSGISSGTATPNNTSAAPSLRAGTSSGAGGVGRTLAVLRHGAVDSLGPRGTAAVVTAGRGITPTETRYVMAS